MAGTRSGAAALLRGIAKAIELEADGCVCELTMQTLTILLAETLDAIDALDGCTCPLLEGEDPCPVHGAFEGWQ